MADLDGVCPYLLEQLDQLQHFGIGEVGLLSALAVCTSQLQVVLLGDQLRLRLAVFFDGVFQNFLSAQQHSILDFGISIHGVSATPCLIPGF